MKKYFDNSQQIESEGILKDEKKEGTWKWYYPNGNLKKQGVYKEDVANGHFYFYHENGQESANGVYKDGKREGDWIWHFADGVLNQKGYYENGKLQEGYIWNYESGQLKTEGYFKDDERHDKWTFYDEQGNVKQITTYKEGKKDGLEQFFHPKSEAIRVHVEYKNGKRNGAYVRKDKKGEIVESGTYVDGFLDGEHIELKEGNKRPTKKQYDRGVPVLTKKRWESKANIISKKNESYQKMRVVEDFVSFSARARTFWYMILNGYLELEENLDVLHEIKDDLALLTPENWIPVFQSLELKDKNMETSLKFVSFWPMALDQICMKTYQKEEFKQAYIENMENFSPKVQEGLRLVQIRYGDADKSVLKEDMAHHFAFQHIKKYGIGMGVSGKDGSFSYVWWTDEGKATKVNLLIPEKRDFPNEKFYEFIELFTTREQWEEAVLATALQNTRLTLPRAIDAIKLASIEQMSKLLINFSADNRFRDYYWSLADWRADTIEELEQIIQSLKEEVGSRAEEAMNALAVVAIIRRKAKNLEVPEWYDEFITFESYYNGKKFDGSYFTGIEHVDQAMEYLEEKRIKKLIQRKLEHNYKWDRVFPFLHFVDEPAFWDEALKTMYSKLRKDETLSNQTTLYLGLSRLGKKGLPWLAAKIDTSAGNVHELFTLALICCMAKLAEQGEEWAEQYDQYMKLHYWPSKYNDYFDTYIRPFWKKAFNALPANRQERILLPQIDISKKTFMRVFSLLDEHTPETTLHAAFDELGKGNLKQPGSNWLTLVLKESLKPKAKPLIKRALQAGAKGKALKSLKNAFSTKFFNRIKKELEEVGQEVAKELTPLEELQQLLRKRYGRFPEEKRTTIYWLERDQKTKLTNKTINRIGGTPIGIDASSHPILNDDPMGHIFTLDLRELPELKKQFNNKTEKGEETVAISLFVADPHYNEAYKAGTEYVQIKHLSEQDLTKGELKDDEFEPYTRGYALKVVPLQVPIRIFGGDIDPENDEMEELKEIKGKVYNAPGYASGEPIWLQHEEYHKNFLLQFDERLADINLGDMGIMYVFKDTAFWQCH